MNIKGHSGCELKLVNDFGLTLVAKSTFDIGYKSRLVAQYEKQRIHNNLLESPVRSPKIRGAIDTDAGFTFFMDYEDGTDFLNFLATAPVEHLNNLTCVLSDYINQNYESLDFGWIASDLLVDKVRSIFANRNSDFISADLKAQCIKIVQTFDCYKLKVGSCHGDLTLSNIIIKNEDATDLSVIDFLDSYIEAPINDMVKLRQDTCFHWSLLMTEQGYDPVRIKMMLRYMDDIFQKNFTKYEEYVNYYHIFQLINILRIGPYCNNNSTKTFVLNAIQNLISNQIRG